MKIDIKMRQTQKSDILVPGVKKTTEITYKSPLRAEITMPINRLVGNLFPNFEHSYSSKIIIDIPGATIMRPVIRLRTLGDLGADTFATAALWTLDDFYYIEEITEGSNG